MGRTIAFVLVFVGLGVTAIAQTTASSPGRGYAEAVAQSAFGNVTSQSYGAEVGVTVAPAIQVFLEGGRVRNAAPIDLASGAAVIAGVLQAQFTAKEPITFGIAGVRYLIATPGPIEPYVLAGVGIARVKKDVAFSVSGSDVTAILQQPPYNTVLGSDLSGSESKAMLALGGGVVWPVWQHLAVDLQYRFGRVFADPRVNVNRAGVGIGVRF
jgi:opacity protein-like surface antigen